MYALPYRQVRSVPVAGCGRAEPKCQILTFSLSIDSPQFLSERAENSHTHSRWPREVPFVKHFLGGGQEASLSLSGNFGNFRRFSSDWAGLKFCTHIIRQPLV